MHIGDADTQTHQRVAFDKVQGFIVVNSRSTRKSLKQGENLRALTQISACEFADDQRMAGDLPMLQQIAEVSVFSTQVVYPDRRIYQDHIKSGLSGVAVSVGRRARFRRVAPAGGCFRARSAPAGRRAPEPSFPECR